MSLEGGCRCGAVRYRVEGDAEHSAICHCVDCRKSSGTPITVWSAFPAELFAVTSGEAKAWHGTGAAVRHFCADCGTGLWYVNEEVLPGLVDIQTVTLDDPEALPPQAQIQAADELSWMKVVYDLPRFERYPGA